MRFRLDRHGYFTCFVWIPYCAVPKDTSKSSCKADDCVRKKTRIYSRKSRDSTFIFRYTLNRFVNKTKKIKMRCINRLLHFRHVGNYKTTPKEQGICVQQFSINILLHWLYALLDIHAQIYWKSIQAKCKYLELLHRWAWHPHGLDMCFNISIFVSSMFNFCVVGLTFDPMSWHILWPNRSSGILFFIVGHLHYVNKYDLITGTVGIVFSSIGIISSGLIVSKLKPPARTLASWNVIGGALTVLGMLCYMYLGCDASQTLGLNTETRLWVSASAVRIMHTL